MRFTIFAAAFVMIPVFAADPPALSPQLKALDVQAGHWIYHSSNYDFLTNKKEADFTWNEYCSWSAIKVFLTCSLNTDWPDEKKQSLVVYAWDANQKTYWHYQLGVGDVGQNSLPAKMSIDGNTWSQISQGDYMGTMSHVRITYVFTSSTNVTVKMEVSPVTLESQHKFNWFMVEEATGIKQP